jgi:2-methylcitrate dehydratase PrpD
MLAGIPVFANCCIRTGGINMSEKSYTEKVSASIVDYKFENFPPEVVFMAKNLMIDLLGAGIGGSVLPEAGIIHDFTQDTGGKPEAAIWGKWNRCGYIDAAMANGYESHILEMDDVHTTACEHPGVSVIPAAVATAERYHLSGKKLIEAIAAGYEAEIRVGEALGTSHYYFWHTTCTGGSFGSAAATGKLLDLT